jgi:hypothetical protein
MLISLVESYRGDASMLVVVALLDCIDGFGRRKVPHGGFATVQDDIRFGGWSLRFTGTRGARMIRDSIFGGTNSFA